MSHLKQVMRLYSRFVKSAKYTKKVKLFLAFPQNETPHEIVDTLVRVYTPYYRDLYQYDFFAQQSLCKNGRLVCPLVLHQTYSVMIDLFVSHDNEPYSIESMSK